MNHVLVVCPDRGTSQQVLARARDLLGAAVVWQDEWARAGWGSREGETTYHVRRACPAKDPWLFGRMVALAGVCPEHERIEGCTKAHAATLAAWGERHYRAPEFRHLAVEDLIAGWAIQPVAKLF